MLNFILRKCNKVSFLYGKKPIQRVVVGTDKQPIEVPLNVVEKLQQQVNTKILYHSNSYHPLPWNQYFKLKLDAKRLIDANQQESTGSALPNIDWFPKLQQLYVAKKRTTEFHVLQKLSKNFVLKIPKA